MAKYLYPSSLPKQEQERLLSEFAIALSEISNPAESLNLIKDMLSKQEAEMLAKRLKIAELILDGYTYKEITEALKVSQGTISRVAEWLKYGGEGYRKIIDRVKKKKGSQKETNPGFDEWSQVKRRYPLMFWPQLLVDEIVASANKRQKERLHKTLQALDHKSQIYKKLNRSLAQEYKPKKKPKSKHSNEF
jgi:TrpR-related protein YerC/YecD